MKPDGTIASINFERNTNKTEKITLHAGNLRFKCQRCAIFCCKLGGPQLSTKDVERLKESSLVPTDFVDAYSLLKSNVKGWCMFLRTEKAGCAYKCAVYQHRPMLCRLYPFHVERISLNSFALKLLPCRGLSRRHGEVVDEKFIQTHLAYVLRELVGKSY